MTCDCKVGAVAERYDLAEISTDLEVLWTEEGESRYSLRELAEYFNQQVLEAAMLDAGMNPLEGEAANAYRLLAGEESGAGHRVQAEHRLEFEGVPVETVTDDFVTHQTVYRHLKNCLEAEYERESDPDTRVERDVERIESFQSRIGIIVEEIVDRLRGAGLFDIGSVTTYVDVQILCEDCGEVYSPGDLLERDGCACDPDRDS